MEFESTEQTLKELEARERDQKDLDNYYIKNLCPNFRERFKGLQIQDIDNYENYNLQNIYDDLKHLINFFHDHANSPNKANFGQKLEFLTTLSREILQKIHKQTASKRPPTQEKKLVSPALKGKETDTKFSSLHSRVQEKRAPVKVTVQVPKQTTSSNHLQSANKLQVDKLKSPQIPTPQTKRVVLPSIHQKTIEDEATLIDSLTMTAEQEAMLQKTLKKYGLRPEVWRNYLETKVNNYSNFRHEYLAKQSSDLDLHIEIAKFEEEFERYTMRKNRTMASMWVASPSKKSHLKMDSDTIISGGTLQSVVLTPKKKSMSLAHSNPPPTLHKEGLKSKLQNIISRDLDCLNFSETPKRDKTVDNSQNFFDTVKRSKASQFKRQDSQNEILKRFGTKTINSTVLSQLSALSHHVEGGESTNRETEAESSSGIISDKRSHLHLSKTIQSITVNNQPKEVHGVSEEKNFDFVEIQDPKAVRRIGLLGAGSEAKVFECHIKDFEQTVALKQYEVKLEEFKNKYTALKREFLMLKQLDHEHIVKYHALYKPTKSYSNFAEFGIVMEYLSGGSLDEYIDKEFHKISFQMKKNLMKQVLKGLDYLHQNNIIHRDLKPENIVLSENKKTVKITDFGIATQRKNQNTMKGSWVGTPWYMAPEVTNYEPYSLKADIWSVGCCFAHLLTGKKPFQSINGIQVLLLLTRDPRPLESYDRKTLEELSKLEGAREFLELCFKKNKNERPTAAELLQHPLLADAE